MDPPPSYQEILLKLNNSTTRNKELEQRVIELQQYLEQTKQELFKTKSAYTVVKKNELMLVTLLQSKI